LSALPRIGLRQLLVGLALAGIVPLAIVATVLLVALWRAQQAQLHEAAAATAYALSVSVEQQLLGTARRLERLARQEAADWKDVRVLSPGDALLPHQQSVLLEGRSSVSGLLSDGSLEIGLPVLEAGKVARGFFARLEPRELSELLRARLRDPASVAGIVDSHYRIIARTRDASVYVGKPALPPLDAAMRAQPAGGVGRFPVYDAPQVYSAWTRVPGTDWTLILGMPAQPAEAALRRSLGALAALLVIVLVASSVFAWLIGRRLADSIHAAAQAAVDLSAGRPAAGHVAAGASRIDEVGTLMDALSRSSERLAAAQAERRNAERERDRMLADEKRLREQAETAGRAKDEFLAMLGHELRNPLGAIGSAAHVIERLPASSADHKAAREIIGRQTAHLAKIVDDLLDVGRVVSGRILLRRNLVDLAQAASAAVATVRAGAQAQRHEWQLELSPVLVSADPTRIDQILSNLLGNAVKFTPAGGHIRVLVEERVGEAVLRVEDDGPGVAAELLPHVFDLFTKDGGPGLGIGLALVRRLVELHGGRVSAENRSEGGARLTVRLPSIPQPQAAAPRTRQQPAPRPPRQARVLIVEDNDDARVTLQRILQSEGHLVSAARDASSGLEAAMAGSPTVAVVDIGLPGMDGYGFARAMRERLGRGVRLIALTGYGTDADRQRAADAGFDAHFTKPVDLERLLALISDNSNYAS
jgi:signal transduction histidine kinase